MISPTLIQEAVDRAARAKQAQQELQSQRSEILSKIKGVNSYLDSLLQKRYRIDLEIKKTKKRIAKLKRMTRKVTSSPDTLSESQSGIAVGSALASSVCCEDNQILLEIQTELSKTDALLTELTNIELS